MKLLKLIAVIMVPFFLQGCFESNVSLSKKLEILKGLTWEEALEKNADCATVNWSSFKDENGNEFAKADCTLRAEVPNNVKKFVEKFVDELAKRKIDDFTLNENYYKKSISDTKDEISKLAITPNPNPLINIEENKNLVEYLSKQEIQFQTLKEKSPLPELEQGKKTALNEFNSKIGSPSNIQAIYIFSISGKTAKFSSLDIAINSKKYNSNGMASDIDLLIDFIGHKDQEKMLNWWVGALSRPIIQGLPFVYH